MEEQKQLELEQKLKELHKDLTPQEIEEMAGEEVKETVTQEEHLLI